MSLSIKSEKAERLARELAMAAGETITAAVTIAVEERLERLQTHRRSAAEERAAHIREIAKDAAMRWSEQYRNVDHGDLLYDESGLPR